MSKGRNGVLGWSLALLILCQGAFVAASGQQDVTETALRLAMRAQGIPESRAVPFRAAPLRAQVADFYSHVAGRPLSPRALDETTAALERLTPRYRSGLAIMLAGMTAAQRLRNVAFSGLTRAEIAHAEDVALRAQFAPETVTTADALAALATIQRIDATAMMRAAVTVREATVRAKPMFAAEEAPEQPVATAYDAIIIGTANGDVYSRDKQLVIDPAGDDTYTNNAGGTLSSQMFDTTGGCVSGGGSTGKASPNLACTPLPSQVCTYDIINNAVGTDAFPNVGLPNHDLPGTGNARDGSCGNDERRTALAADTANITNDGDSRGVSVLLDLGGSDTYTAPWTHDDALFGLVDFCFPGEQSKTNTNRDFIQGGTLAGVALLWDDGPGNNVFRSRLNSQGSGHVGGVGMLFSTGGGDDVYWADRLAQGNGIAGGVGVLVDTGGTNTFLLEPPVVYRNEFRPGGRECSQQGRAGQGQGGFLGTGVLWSEGDAVYRAVVHETATTHPFAPVLDGQGAPVLVRGTDSQGSGESFPIPNTPGGLVAGAGILVDRGSGDSLCPGAGKVTGAEAPNSGTVDRSCGTFNLSPEIAASDLATALEHLAGGAVGLRVVLES